MFTWLPKEWVGLGIKRCKRQAFHFPEIIIAGGISSPNIKKFSWHKFFSQIIPFRFTYCLSDIHVFLGFFALFKTAPILGILRILCMHYACEIDDIFRANKTYWTSTVNTIGVRELKNRGAEWNLPDFYILSD